MKKIVEMKRIFTLLVVLLMAGCMPGKHDPILLINIDSKEEKYRYSGVATQVDRRLVLATTKSSHESSICAEPFPDGAALLDKLKTFNLTVAGKISETTDSYKFDVTIPFEPHPAVKFYRDGVFALCQAAMNDWIDTKARNVYLVIEDGGLKSVSIRPRHYLSDEDINKVLEEDTKNQNNNTRLKNFLSTTPIEELRNKHQLKESVEGIFDASNSAKKDASTFISAIQDQIKKLEAGFTQFEFQLFLLTQSARDILVEEAKAKQNKAEKTGEKKEVESAEKGTMPEGSSK